MSHTQASEDSAAQAAVIATRPLFAPLASLLRAFPAGLPSNVGPLNEISKRLELHLPCGRELRFVAPGGAGMSYEERIVVRAQVETRTPSWHDFFNALVWMRFPRTKMALAQLHADIMRTQPSDGGRGPLRDAATQFDESGIVVASADPGLLELLCARRWQELFVSRRRGAIEQMRFIAFGHGLYDALRAPFYRICGRAALVEVARDCIEGDVDAQCAQLDAILADRFTARTWYPRPKTLLALPLLGIPGVCEENERTEYYADTLQFRPPPKV